MFNDITHWYIGIGSFIAAGVVFSVLFGVKLTCCAIRKKRKKN